MSGCADDDAALVDVSAMLAAELAGLAGVLDMRHAATGGVWGGRGAIDQEALLIFPPLAPTARGCVI